MHVTMDTVVKYRKLFIELQRENQVHDMFNVNDAKWTMRDILMQLDNEKEFELLIRAFFIMSPRKTWDDFQYNYNEYYEAWTEYRLARKQRKALLEETINRRKLSES